MGGGDLARIHASFLSAAVVLMGFSVEFYAWSRNVAYVEVKRVRDYRVGAASEVRRRDGSGRGPRERQVTRPHVEERTCTASLTLGHLGYP